MNESEHGHSKLWTTVRTIFLFANVSKMKINGGKNTKFMIFSILKTKANVKANAKKKQGLRTTHCFSLLLHAAFR